ncbi:hypothetical protein AP071_07435 [Rhodobacter capsulatus]|nr:hypothetical protein AP071_07435 [Rhodobacter capsulatus]KQB12707.1 hypothetical protein AP073_06290 [Rhodobacter capsulatus]
MNGPQDRPGAMTRQAKKISAQNRAPAASPIKGEWTSPLIVLAPFPDGPRFWPGDSGMAGGKAY